MLCGQRKSEHADQKAFHPLGMALNITLSYSTDSGFWDPGLAESKSGVLDTASQAMDVRVLPPEVAGGCGSDANGL